MSDRAQERQVMLTRSTEIAVNITAVSAVIRGAYSLYCNIVVDSSNEKDSTDLSQRRDYCPPAPRPAPPPIPPM